MAIAATVPGPSPAPIGAGAFCSMMRDRAGTGQAVKKAVWAAVSPPRPSGAITMAALAPAAAPAATWARTSPGSAALAPTM